MSWMRRNSKVIALCGALAGAAALSMTSISRDGSAQNNPAPMVIEGDAAPRPWRRYADPSWPTTDFSKFNTLADVSRSPPAPKQPRKLSGPVTRDAANGQKLVADRSRGGSCLACHVMGPAGGADLPGNVGPDLSQIGNAGREDEWLLNYVYDARVYNPQTVMPPWGTNGIFNDKEIGDIVAFLKTLKTPATFSSALDDPNKRPTPVESRENLDALENPGMWAVDKAPVLWQLPGPSGSACANCHDQPERSFKSWAASMPKWEPRLDKVVGIEEFVTRHAKATTGHVWLMQSDENTALAVYLRYVSNDAPINVDITSAPARAAYERGKALTEREIGQLNFACVDCHTSEKGASKWIRGQWLGEFRGQLDHFPTWRTSRQAIWDIRKRFQWCAVAIGSDELPPDAKEYGELELYLAAQNAGLKLSVPGIRH
jgi:L-cysteine S-thiosulfotransferase